MATKETTFLALCYSCVHRALSRSKRPRQKMKATIKQRWFIELRTTRLLFPALIDTSATSLTRSTTNGYHYNGHSFNSCIVFTFMTAVPNNWTVLGVGRYRKALFACPRPFPAINQSINCLPLALVRSSFSWPLCHCYCQLIQLLCFLALICHRYLSNNYRHGEIFQTIVLFTFAHHSQNCDHLNSATDRSYHVMIHVL